jgi:hypothetical protein
VTEIPTIVLAGGDQLLQQLRLRFPPNTCRIVQAELLPQAVRGAVGSKVVVVEGDFKGAEELCVRLRSDPMTAHVPLVCVVRRGSDARKAPVNARVMASDMARLEQTLLLFCPSLSPPDGAGAPPPVPAEKPKEDSGEFDADSQTVAFRRPTTAPGLALEWPPPPPSRPPGQDLVEFASSYVGYINSLIEALQDLPSLSAEERQRLAKVSRVTLEDAEVFLDSIQSTINEALMAKDLARMRGLSSAKNSIYDRRRRMQGLLDQMEHAPPEPEPQEEQEVRARKLSSQRKASPEQKGLTRSRISTGQTPPVRPSGEYGPSGTYVPPAGGPPAKKSELTLRAEAREAERRVANAQARREASAAARPTGPMRAVAGARPGRPRIGVKPSQRQRPSLLLSTLLVLLLAGGGLALYQVLRQRPTEVAVQSDTGNRLPVMKWVILEQTPAGIVARLQASDAEGDRVSFKIRWFVNGEEVKGALTARLHPNRYKAGNTIYAEVRPEDAHGKGIPMRSRDLMVKAGSPPERAPKKAPQATPPPASGTPR